MSILITGSNRQAVRTRLRMEQCEQRALNMVAQTPHDVDQAIKKLRSFHDGDLGVIDVIACGTRTIPALRALLFEREPSGLFQTRCRAVDALAALDARDVLLEFLSAPHEAIDPVERLGDDAVVNAAARAVARYREEQVFQLLLTLARYRPLPGVIAALGKFDRPESIPCLIDALLEDECRPAAEAALDRLGPSARLALLQAATPPAPSLESDSASNMRRRRSALGLLAKIGGSL
jgi:hypothetical protein